MTCGDAYATDRTPAFGIWFTFLDALPPFRGERDDHDVVRLRAWRSRLRGGDHPDGVGSSPHLPLVAMRRTPNGSGLG